MSWVLAIDFGTSNTTAAHAADGAAPVVLPVDGLSSIPSLVAADPDGHLVAGRAARNQAYLHRERAERAPKRALAAGGEVMLGERAYKPEEVAAAVLRKAHDEALRSHGGAAPAAVILTHPARWSREVADRLREAADLAGIAAPALISEPEAAAWGYGPPVPGQVVGVFDLGGSGLDVAVLRATETGYTLVGQPGGDGELGGDYFDGRLLGWVLDRARERDEAAWAELTSPRGLRAARDRARLGEQVTLAREALSTSAAQDVVIDSFDEGFRVTREGFEALVDDLAARAAGQASTAILAAGVDPATLAALYLAGGASNTPLIARRLRSVLGIQPRLTENPKEIVALGALRAHAAQSSGGDSEREPEASAGNAVRLTRLPLASERARETVTSFNAGKERALAAWSPDDSHLAVCFGQGIEIWAMPGGVKLKSITWRIWSSISAMAWSPDGGYLVTGQVDSSALKIWSLSGEMRQLAVPDAGSVRSLAWHPGGDRVAVVDGLGTVRVVDLLTGAPRAVLTGGASGLPDAPVAWHPDPAPGNDLLIVAGADGTVVRWNHDMDSAGGLYPRADELLDLGSAPGAFAWSGDGSRFAACGGGSFRIWDKAEPPAARRHPGRRVGGGEITAASWAGRGRYLLTALTDSSRRTDKVVGLTLWDVASGEQVRSWTDAYGEFVPCRGIALSNRGSRIRVACVRRGEAPAVYLLSAG